LPASYKQTIATVHFHVTTELPVL